MKAHPSDTPRNQPGMEALEPRLMLSTTAWNLRFEAEDTQAVWQNYAEVITGEHSVEGDMTAPTYATAPPDGAAFAGAGVVPPEFGWFSSDPQTGFATQSLAVFSHFFGDAFGHVGHAGIDGEVISGTTRGQWNFQFQLSLTTDAQAMDTSAWNEQPGIELVGEDGQLLFVTYDDGDLELHHGGGSATLVSGFDALTPYTIEAKAEMGNDQFTVWVDGVQVGGTYDLISTGSGGITGFEARGGHTTGGHEGHQAFYDNITLFAPRAEMAFTYQLPPSPVDTTYRVSIGIAPADDPDWIVKTFLAGEPRTVTADNGGQFTEIWDGSDDNYGLLPDGDYVAKAIYMSADQWDVDGQYHTVNAQYKFLAGDSWNPAGSRDDVLPWIFGHNAGPVMDIQVGPNGKAGFLTFYTEGTWNPHLVDLNDPINYDQVEQTYQSWYTAGGSSVASDGQLIWVYTNIYGNHAIYRPDRAGGQHHWGPDDMAGGGIPDVTVNSKFMDADVPSMHAWRDGADNVFLYVAQRDDTDAANDKVIILDGKNDSAAVLDSIALETPQAIVMDRANPGTRMYALHQDNGVWTVSSIALANGVFSGGWTTEFAVPATIANPSDMEIDSTGTLWIVDPSAELVYRVDSAGTSATPIGTGSAPAGGAYDPGTFYAPGKLAIWKDDSGVEHLLVVEHAGPSRTSQWSISATSTLERQWFLSQNTGEIGFVGDPANMNHLYTVGIGQSHLVRYVVDYQAETWDVDAVWDLPQDGSQHLRVYNHNGHKYITFAGGNQANANFSIYRIDGYDLHSSAAIVDGEWWHDADDDGVVEASEKTGPAELPAHDFWGEQWLADLSLMSHLDGEYWHLAPSSFDAHGNPVYEGTDWELLFSDFIRDAWKADPDNGPTDPLYGGHEDPVWYTGTFSDIDGSLADGFYWSQSFGPNTDEWSLHEFNMQRTMAKVMHMAPDGQGGYEMVWRVGERAHEDGTMERGQMYIPLRVNGPTDGVIGVHDMFAGCYHLYTTDGLYFDTIGVDAYAHEAMSLVPVTHSANTGMYFISDGVWQAEHFVDDSTGKAYWMIGRAAMGVYEIEGWGPNMFTQLPVTPIEQYLSITATDPQGDEYGDTATFTVHRMGPADGPLTVHYTVSGDATAGDDYEALSGTLVIGPDERDAEITILPLDDDDLEAPEDLVLTLTADAAYTLRPGASSASVVLHDNDTEVTVIASDPAAAEDPAGGTTFWDLRFESEDTASVWYTRATVHTGPYSPDGGMVYPTWSSDNYGSFAGAAVVAPTFGNYYFDDDSTGFDSQSLSLFSHFQGGAYTGGMSIGGPGLEGTDTGTWRFEFDISLTSMAVGADTSTWGMQGGVLLNGTDGNLLFVTYDDGDLRVQHGGGWATIIDDFEAVRPYGIDMDVDMGSDTFTVFVDGVSVGTYGFVNPGAGSLTGMDARGGTTGGPEGHFAFYDNFRLATPGDGWKDTGEFTFTRTGSGALIDDDLTVNYTISGNVVPGFDVEEPLAGSIVIPAGETSVTLMITPIDDTIAENPNGEALTLLLAPGGYTIGEPNSAVVTIEEDDRAEVNVTAIDAIATEQALPQTLLFENAYTTEDPGPDAPYDRVPVDLGPYLAEGGMTLPTYGNESQFGDGHGARVVHPDWDYTEPQGTGLTSAGMSVASHFWGLTNSMTGFTGIDGPGLAGTETGTLTFSFDISMLDWATQIDTDDWEIEPGVYLRGNDPSRSNLLGMKVDEGNLVVLHAGGRAPVIVGFDTYAAYHIEVDLDMDDDTFIVKVDGSQVGNPYELLTTGHGISGYEIRGGQPLYEDPAGWQGFDALYDHVKLVAYPKPNRGTYRITRDGTGGDLTVHYTLAGTAGAGDYTENLTGTVVIPDGETSAEINITPVADGIYEGDETVRIILLDDPDYDLGDAGAATVEILDHRQTVGLSEVDTQAAEAGGDEASFLIERDDTYGDLTVQYTIGGSADNGADYERLSGSIVIPDGQSSAMLTVTPIDDGEHEPAESFTVTLVEDDAYNLDESALSGEATILSDDGTVVSVVPADAYAAEDAAGVVTYFENTFSTEQPPAGGRVNVVDTQAYDPAGGMTAPTWASQCAAAFAGAGVAAPNYGGYHEGTATGLASDSLSVYSHWMGDAYGYQGRAQVRGSGFAGTGTGTYVFAYEVSFTDNSLAFDTDDWDVAPGVVLEGAGNLPLLEMFLDAGDLKARHAGGVATLLEGYATYTPYTVEALVDMDADTFLVKIDGQSVGSLFEQITPTDGTLISGYEARGGIGGDANAAFYDNISLTTYPRDIGAIVIERNGTYGDLTVHYTVSGSADGGDYDESLTGSVVIPDGNDSAVLTVSPFDDGQPEGTENVAVTLTADAAYAIDGGGEGEVFIVDAGESLPTTVELIVDDGQADESGPDPAQLTVQRIGTSGDLTVYYTLAGTADAGDYDETLSGSILIEDGQDSATITITPTDDAQLELAETLTVRLKADAAYGIDLQADQATVIIADDEVTNGVSWQVFVGEFTPMPDFGQLTPDAWGTADTFDVSGAPTPDWWVMEFITYLQVPQAGEYTFWIEADDAGELYIDGMKVVEHVGARTGQTELSAGVHPLRVTHFESWGGEFIDVYWSGPGFDKQLIPESMLLLAEPGEDRVWLEVADGVADEAGQDPAELVFTREGTTGDLTVHYQRSGTVGSDDIVEPMTGSVVIPDGEDSVTVTLTPVDDGEAEGREVMFFELSGGAGYSIATPSRGQVILWDDEPAPMLLHWTLDGTTADASGNNTFGELGGDAAFTDIRWQGTHGLAVDGEGDYVINGVDLSDAWQDETITVALWVKADEPGVIVSELGQKDPNTLWHISDLEVIDSGEVRGRFHGLHWLPLGTIEFGEWHHLALRYDAMSGTLEGFLDGVKSSETRTGNRSTSIEGGQKSFWAFGAADTSHLGDGSALGGALDDIRLYNQYVSDQEIAELAGEGLAEVGLFASDVGAWEEGSDPGAVTFQRSGTDGDLTVYYQVTGTADSGDYVEVFSGSATIPDGENTVTLQVTPVDDTEVEGHETLTFSLMAGGTAYAPADSRLATVHLHDNELTSTANLVDVDEATRGSWQGVYGSDGYEFQYASIAPPYATVTLVGNAAGSWSGYTTDPLALEMPDPDTHRVMPVWYEVDWSIDVQVTDGQSHQFALYVIDYDRQNRRQRIDAVDVASETVLSSIDLGDIEQGRWLVYDVAGHVRFDIERLFGPNAVVSAWMFDPVQSGPSVTLATLDGEADEEAGDSGSVLVSRQGTDGDLDVHYTISGTADGADYVETLSGTVTIPDGQSSVVLTVTPVDDAEAEDFETVTIRLERDAGYRVVSPQSGTVTITDKDFSNPQPYYYWTFDGDVTDQTGRADGTFVNGTASYEPGWAGQALVFDGVNDYVNAPDVELPGGDADTFTISWWIKPTALQHYSPMVGAASGWAEAFLFHGETGGSIYTGINTATRFDPTDIPSGTIETGVWQQFVYVYNNGTQKLFKNGQRLAVSEGVSAPVAWNGWRWGSGDGHTIYGLLDDARIYDVALTEYEVGLLASLQTPAPAEPDLASGSDTGTSDTDDLTRRNNAAGSETLAFTVGQTVSGATVTIHADGVAIGSAVATGATTTVTTDGVTALADGTVVITADQQLPGWSPSVPSPAMSVDIDTAAPAVVGSSLDDALVDPWQVDAITFTVAGGDVSAGLEAGDLVLSYKDAAGTHVVDPADMQLTYQHNPGGDDLATWTFPGLPGGVLPDGMYSAELAGASTADAAGNVLDADNDGAPGGDYTADFVHAIPGDANLDRVVDVGDLGILAGHWGSPTAEGILEGDFNTDGTVDVGDLGILAGHWGESISAGTASLDVLDPPAALSETAVESPSVEPTSADLLTGAGTDGADRLAVGAVAPIAIGEVRPATVGGTQPVSRTWWRGARPLGLGSADDPGRSLDLLSLDLDGAIADELGA